MIARVLIVGEEKRNRVVMQQIGFWRLCEPEFICLMRRLIQPGIGDRLFEPVVRIF
jgi:hypothetical protein